VSLLVGIAVLALAVLLGGLAAIYYEHARGAVPVVRTFAVAAAVSVALLHLLPEAVSAAGWWVLAAAAAGLVVPALLERALAARHAHDHGHRQHAHQGAPTTALALGYAAVIAHQAGEGAALATLARSGSLSFGIVLAIAAHTVPLAMVVAIRVLEVDHPRDRAAHTEGRPTSPPPGRQRATVIALAGVALATAAGAAAGSVVSTAQLESIEPWMLAAVAGILLHALWHDALLPAAKTRAGRVVDAMAGMAGLGLAALSVEEGDWTAVVPSPLGAVGAALLAVAIVARSTLVRGGARPHHHD
jgi:ZIP family zinc transporter